MTEPEANLNAYLNQMSPTNLISNIKLEAFKSNQMIQGVDGKLHRAEEAKGERPNSPL